MALINWSEKLSTQIQSVDEQHKKLIALINELHDAMRAGQGKEVLGRTLNELVDYTVYHFKYEEDIMKRTGYSDGINHINEHKNLTNTAIELRDKYNQGIYSITIDTMNFLKDWLNNHIQQTDKKYTAHFIAKGIR